MCVLGERGTRRPRKGEVIEVDQVAAKKLEKSEDIEQAQKDGDTVRDT